MLTTFTEELSKDFVLLNVKVPCVCVEWPCRNNPESHDDGSVIGIAVHVKNGRVVNVVDTSKRKSNPFPNRNGIDFNGNMVLPLFSDVRVYLGKMFRNLSSRPITTNFLIMIDS